MAIFMTARFRVRREALSTCIQAIAEFIDYVQNNEPGTRLYASLQETEDETAFLHYFIFEDEEARQAHRASAGVKRFTDSLYPTLIGEVEFKIYRLLATTPPPWEARL